ncbi:ERV/ALR sulfhydryl oxidase domain-containing protein [Podospora fimiseda]|uniref:Sulfhydryl oxidase n=1 Tax=Podospora fimiseda TaxID=252190 RepID=A0AAN7BRH1_9PEZI|nr:ERV/ALR sulfhydryl oxidase domain-containing protein [Podospora fimiseda]
MADDTQDNQSSTGTTASSVPMATTTTTTTTTTTRPLPKGMILDKDGKPCRSCNSGQAFAAWAAQTKKKLPTTPVKKRTDCPADSETLGRSTWTLLHSIAATYPRQPTSTQQTDLTSFIKLFSKFYPCWVCAEDFQAYIEREKVKAGSRDEFGNWLCEAHNEVNRKLGKPEFDCKRWEERWRTGWKDGSCD